MEKVIKVDDFFVRLRFNENRGQTIQPTDIHKEKTCRLCKLIKDTKKNSATILKDWLIFEDEYIVVKSMHNFKNHNQKIFQLLDCCKQIKGKALLSDGFMYPEVKLTHSYFHISDVCSIPLYTDVKRDNFLKAIDERAEGKIWILKNYIRSGFYLQSKSSLWISEYFYKLENIIGTNYSLGKYPYLNIVCWYQNENWNLVVFPRVVQKSSHYYRFGKDQIRIFPQAYEISGLFILEDEYYFDILSAEIIKEIFSEISFSYTHMKEIVKHL